MSHETEAELEVTVTFGYPFGEAADEFDRDFSNDSRTIFEITSGFDLVELQSAYCSNDGEDTPCDEDGDCAGADNTCMYDKVNRIRAKANDATGTATISVSLPEYYAPDGVAPAVVTVIKDDFGNLALTAAAYPACATARAARAARARYVLTYRNDELS